MSTGWVTIVPRERGTRVLMMQGQDEMLRAVLPPFPEVRHEQAVTRLLEGLSLWMDQRLCVALCADESAHSFRLALTDEQGMGSRSVHYAVEPLPLLRRGHGRRLRGVGDFTDMRQMSLWAASSGGQQ